MGFKAPKSAFNAHGLVLVHASRTSFGACLINYKILKPLGRVCKGDPWAWLRPREPILVFGGVFSSLSLAHAVQILLSLMALRKR